MKNSPTTVRIRYSQGNGIISVSEHALLAPIWTRLNLAVRNKGFEHRPTRGELSLSWLNTLDLIREFGSKSNQISLNFRFCPDDSQTSTLIREFAAQIRQTREQRNQLCRTFSANDINSKLNEKGFTGQELFDFQLRDLSHLLSLSNGANFSVPGAGKTTVTFALHILTRKIGHHFIVVAPKSAFQAWINIVSECMSNDASENGAEPFTLLVGHKQETKTALNSGATRFLVSYDMSIRLQSVIANHFSTFPTHLVLDESHRMKAGWHSQRGAFFLKVAHLPVRRDILSGTPMPQASTDIQSQLDFLWPGHGYGLDISTGKPPREILGNLYVRTTKSELNLPPVKREFIDITMNDGQLALYSIVRNEFIRQYSSKIKTGLNDGQFLRARRSVMRLLQLSINPTLALSSMANDNMKIDSAVIDQVLDEGHSAKMAAVMDLVYELVESGEKCVIWTIFTDTIRSFASSLADLNPVCIHGGVNSGSPDEPESREGRIRLFHEDSDCSVLIANPATAGEGISLHTVCHNAIYADRSYVSTHYLQSIDRIHRLGLAPDVETCVYIFRSKAPPAIGSIDMSVGHRLEEKIRNMQILLDDPDLHKIALDEEESADPLDYDLDLKDIMNLIAELEGTALQPQTVIHG